MTEFILKEITTRDMASELSKIGFDSAYKSIAEGKYRYKTLKIFNLTPPQANILKQTALICGSDCAVHREVITGNIEYSNAILGGSFSELKNIAEKLGKQPFSLSKLGKKILKELQPREKRTKLAGILNITPNSFSDGGIYLDEKKACEHLYKLIEDGADLIDIGAESTKPYAEAVPADVQIKRLKPVISEIRKLSTPTSIDTRSSAVARYALENGVSIINDVSGLEYDSLMADVAAQFNCGIIIQHSTCKTEDRPVYDDIAEDVYFKLLRKIEFAKSKGVNNIIIDPGIGFGKSRDENFELINRIEEFYSLETPIMMGISRKSFMFPQECDNNDLKDSVSLAVSYPLIQKGVDYLRVHNVKLHRQLLNSVY